MYDVTIAATHAGLHPRIRRIRRPSVRQHLQSVKAESGQIRAQIVQKQVIESVDETSALLTTGAVPVASEHQPCGKIGIEVRQYHATDEMVKRGGIGGVFGAIRSDVSKQRPSHRGNNVRWIVDADLDDSGSGC